MAGKGLGPLGPGRLLAVSSQPSTFHGFIKTSWRISINIAGMSALKLENLPKLVIRWMRAKILLHNVAKFCRVGATNLPVPPSPRPLQLQRPHNVCKIRRLCGAISRLAFITSCSNLVLLLTPRRSLYSCWRIFANWSQQIPVKSWKTGQGRVCFQDRFFGGSETGACKICSERNSSWWIRCSRRIQDIQ